jgi:hypothetical protein
MAGQITIERPWVNIPTKQLVNTETGQTEVFIINALGNEKVAEAGENNVWVITDKQKLLNRYNQQNPTKTLPNTKELDKVFYTSGTKQFNADRADVINKNSTDNDKTRFATKVNPVPGVKDPKTGITAGQTAPQAGISTTPPGPGFGTNLSTGIGEKNKTRNDFSRNLKYPINLKSESQDVIKFNMVRYEPKKFQAERLEFGERKENRQIIGTVTLPIPAGISDMNACNWGGQDINAFEAGTQNLAMASIPGGGAGFSDTFKKLAEGIQGSNAEVKAAITAAFTASATNTNQVLQRTSGLVINQNLELLFGGPTLRPFSFTFKMSAREKGEAEEIRSIIRFFKQGMSPIRTQSSLFLKTPHTFQIQYRHKNEEHKFLNKFKECALTSFSVNYTPEGQYATYTDGVMVSYEMQMQFTELEPIFNDEYENSKNAKDTEIGF